MQIDQNKAEKIVIGATGVSVGMLVGVLIVHPKFKKVITLAKLSSQLLQWQVDNGVHMSTPELDHELYEKLSFIGLAARGMK